jgi:hypothetical protein
MTQISDTDRMILRGLDATPGDFESLEKMGREDIVGLSVALDSLSRRGLVDYVDGSPFPSADGTRAAWS